MAGLKNRGGRMTRRQQRGLYALLASDSVVKAAVQSGIGERTLRRWLSEPGFRAAYQHASRQLWEQATAELRIAAVEAVRRLREALHSESESVAVRSAAVILSTATHIDLDEVLRRIEALENNETSNVDGAAACLGAAQAATDNDNGIR